MPPIGLGTKQSEIHWISVGSWISFETKINWQCFDKFETELTTKEERINALSFPH